VCRARRASAGDPTVPLNSCYVLACRDPDDALAVAALLNSPLAAAWLGRIAEPARGGWHRYLAWTVALLPLPHDWPRARSILAPIAERAILDEPPRLPALLEAVCAAYRLKQCEVAPLLAWSHRADDLDARTTRVIGSSGPRALIAPPPSSHDEPSATLGSVVLRPDQIETAAECAHICETRWLPPRRRRRHGKDVRRAGGGARVEAAARGASASLRSTWEQAARRATCDATSSVTRR
jgi:hypothetical protein